MKKAAIALVVMLMSCGLSAAFGASAPASELVTFSVPSRCIDPTKVVMANPPPGKPERAPDLRVNVLLPDGYDGVRRFPVLYLLTGAGAYDYWIDFSDGELAKAVADLPAIVVMPESGIVGTYNNSWNGGTREPCWEYYFLDELVPEIERQFRVLPGRRWHAIGGFSSGGFGAVNYAAKKPGYFGQVLSLSGVLDIQRPELQYGEGFLLILAIFSPDKILEVGPTPYRDAFGDPVAQEFYWAGHNPPKLAEALSHTRMYIAHGGPTAPTCIDPFLIQYHCAIQELVGGLLEETLNRDYAAHFMPAARAAGVPFTYRPQTGGHWYPYAARFLADAIDNWGLFEPVEENPEQWAYKTVSQTGDMWGLRFTFDDAPETVETFAREGDLLRGEGSGIVTIEPPAGSSFTETLPFVRAFPQ